jgi:hypothetical protein
MKERKKERKIIPMLPPVWIMVVPHSSSWSKSKCNPEMGVTWIRGGTEVYCLLSKVNAMNGWVWTSRPAPISPRFPRGWKISSSPGNPRGQWVDNRWEEISAREATHPSTILVLGGLILEFPCDPGRSLGCKPLFLFFNINWTGIWNSCNI